jgi:hypothetical protein
MMRLMNECMHSLYHPVSIKIKSKPHVIHHLCVCMSDKASHTRTHHHDRLGIVLFNHQSYLAKPLAAVTCSSDIAIQGGLVSLKPRGKLPLPCFHIDDSQSNQERYCHAYINVISIHSSNDSLLY